MNNPNNPNNPCIFCYEKKNNFIKENNLAYATFDPYPVTKNHALIIPKRHVKNYFELSDEEVIECNNLIKFLKKYVQGIDDSVEGFNLGSNTGIVAGQSIMHCHIHLIPRRLGDVENPQGGIRAVVQSKQHYVRKS